MVALYSIRDSVTEVFGPVFSAQNDRAASRMFALAEFPGGRFSDFALYCVGTFEPQSPVTEVSVIDVVEMYQVDVTKYEPQLAVKE